jgi:hypothetical protein
MSGVPDISAVAARAREAWRHLTALLLLLHMVAVVLLALPLPGSGLRRSHWDSPTVQAEFQALRERLARLGVVVGREELEDRLYTLALDYSHAHERLVEPLTPYARTAGAQQSWRMFVAPDTHPSVLHVEVEEAAGWRTVFRERSPEWRWAGEVLEHYRVRSALFRHAWSPESHSWAEWVDWLTVKAARDFPRATQLRVSFEQRRTPAPDEMRAGVSHPLAVRGVVLRPLKPARAVEQAP